MPINRRSFIKETGAALLASSLLPSVADAMVDPVRKLTILHTNDVHSRIDPFPMDGSRNQGLGGVAARAALIAKIRQEEEQVLVLDAGDIFQGTPYFNIYKGEPEIKAMTAMGYDAATMGNHDFDLGMANFATQLKHASFPILMSNYDFTGTELEGKTQPWKICRKGALQVGIFGVGIELQGLVPENLYGKTVYQDPVEAANRTANLLHRKGCDLVICLSHLGDRYTENKISDELLAKESYDIDLIIGGHTHRFFEEPRKYTNKGGGDVVVNQVGFGGIQLGRLEYEFSRSSRKKLANAHTVVVGKKTSE